MAFDLKAAAASPDTSFPAGGILFGADSAAATNPSAYSDTAYLNYILGLANTWTAGQTITPAAANTTPLTVSGYSLTSANAQSLFDLSGTWNTSGNPVALKLAITITAAGATAKFLEFLGGAGGATSVFSVDKTGLVTAAGGFNLDAAGSAATFKNNSGYSAISNVNGGVGVLFTEYNTNASTGGWGRFTSSAFYLSSGLALSWTNTANDVTATIDTRLHRDAAGIVRVGGINTTTPGGFSFYTYGASPPAAPSASIARLYADTSGGKIRLMAIFPSGAAQQIAIEP